MVGGGGGDGSGGVVYRYESAIVFLRARADRCSDDNLQTNEELVEAAIAFCRANE